MIYGAVYLALLPLLSYLFGNRDSIQLLVVICTILLLDMHSTTIFPYLGGDNFFLSKAITDLVILTIISKSSVISAKKLITAVLTFVSLSINTYLCFELGDVFVYRYWETINLFLCELIFLTLICSDKGIRMFSTIKTYIYGAAAAVVLFLAGMLKYRTVQKENLEKELEVEKHNSAVKDSVVKKEKEIQTSLDKVKQESEKVHEQNKKDAISGKRPSGSFLDPRL